jgi:geranylgeranylglycerol-phosphate geranylgeranyltransferase
MSPSSTHPPQTVAFWRAYWVTLRPYLFFVSGASGLVGLALAGEVPAAVVAPAFLAFFFSYGLGQAVTDVFQTDTDALSSPYRPLVRGEIAGGPVLAVSLVGLALCSAVFVILCPANGLLALAAVVGLLTYTPLKRRVWGGPFWNSWIVALLPVMGLFCGARSATSGPTHSGLAWASLSVFFTYAVFVLLGYFKDVEADRRTGYETLPVRLGRPASVGISAALCALGLAASARLVHGAALPSVGGLLWLTGVLLLAGAHLRILPTTRDDEAHAAIAMVVRGYVALHLGEAALLRPSLEWLVLALYVLFEAALVRRPCRSQI